MSEAVGQHNENHALKEERASLRSSVKDLESDEAGSLQRILGLERMSDTLEPQVAKWPVISTTRQQLRMENSEISALLRKAIEATNEYNSMVSSGTDLRTKLSH